MAGFIYYLHPKHFISLSLSILMLHTHQQNVSTQQIIVVFSLKNRKAASDVSCIWGIHGKQQSPPEFVSRLRYKSPLCLSVIACVWMRVCECVCTTVIFTCMTRRPVPLVLGGMTVYTATTSDTCACACIAALGTLARQDAFSLTFRRGREYAPLNCRS